MMHVCVAVKQIKPGGSLGLSELFALRTVDTDRFKSRREITSAAAVAL
jgi:hypothetical protein